MSHLYTYLELEFLLNLVGFLNWSLEATFTNRGKMQQQKHRHGFGCQFSCGGHWISRLETRWQKKTRDPFHFKTLFFCPSEDEINFGRKTRAWEAERFWYLIISTFYLGLLIHAKDMFFFPADFWPWKNYSKEILQQSICCFFSSISRLLLSYLGSKKTTTKT